MSIVLCLCVSQTCGLFCFCMSSSGGGVQRSKVVGERYARAGTRTERERAAERTPLSALDDVRLRADWLQTQSCYVSPTPPTNPPFPRVVGSKVAHSAGYLTL